MKEQCATARLNSLRGALSPCVNSPNLHENHTHLQPDRQRQAVELSQELSHDPSRGPSPYGVIFEIPRIRNGYRTREGAIAVSPLLAEILHEEIRSQRVSHGVHGRFGVSSRVQGQGISEVTTDAGRKDMSKPLHVEIRMALLFLHIPT